MDSKDISRCPHRQRFLHRRSRQIVHQYALVICLVTLMILLVGLQMTVGDSVLCPVATYILVSTFIILVCLTNGRCCSVHRKLYRPLPSCLHCPGELYQQQNVNQTPKSAGDDCKANNSNVIYILLDGTHSHTDYGTITSLFRSCR